MATRLPYTITSHTKWRHDAMLAARREKSKGNDPGVREMFRRARIASLCVRVAKKQLKEGHTYFSAKEVGEIVRIKGW